MIYVKTDYDSCKYITPGHVYLCCDHPILLGMKYIIDDDGANMLVSTRDGLRSFVMDGDRLDWVECNEDGI